MTDALPKPTHEYDTLTNYCVKCGISRESVMWGYRLTVCRADPTKVVAISHIVRGKRLRGLVQK